jgi:hypothetical protein
MDRAEPDPVHAEPRDVVEVLDQASKVAVPVAVRVGEGARVDLIEDTGAPPR